MIRDDRLTSYLHSLIPDGPAWLEELRLGAEAGDVPILRRETEELLKLLVAMQQPKRILEVGTAVGYSALVMREVMPEGCHIDTIENYPPRIEAAKKNFAQAEDDISLYEGDAEEVLVKLTGPYDLVFLDAAKGQYGIYLELILPMLSSGAVLITDNVLQDGEVLEAKTAVIKRNRTIHGRMRDYLYTLTHHELLRTSVVPIGDGVAISRKEG